MATDPAIARAFQMIKQLAQGMTRLAALQREPNVQGFTTSRGDTDGSGSGRNQRMDTNRQPFIAKSAEAIGPLYRTGRGLW